MKIPTLEELNKQEEERVYKILAPIYSKFGFQGILHSFAKHIETLADAVHDDNDHHKKWLQFVALQVRVLASNLAADPSSITGLKIQSYIDSIRRHG